MSTTISPRDADSVAALLAAKMLEAHLRRCELCQLIDLRCFVGYALEARLRDAIEREARALPPELFARRRGEDAKAAAAERAGEA